MWGMPEPISGSPVMADQRPVASDPASMQQLRPVHTGAVLAFDFGEKRIGVAVGEFEIAMAHPLTTIAGEHSKLRFDAIARLIAEWRPRQLVVGLPLNMDDSEHAMSARARRFARQLEGRFNLPVAMVDERLTTRDAAAQLTAAGVDSRRQRPIRDQVAARTILLDYFEQHEQS